MDWTLRPFSSVKETYVIRKRDLYHMLKWLISHVKRDLYIMCCGLFAHFLAPFACSRHDTKETYLNFKSDLYHMQKRPTSYVKKNLKKPTIRCGLFAHFLAPFVCLKHQIQLYIQKKHIWCTKVTYITCKRDLHHM